MTTTERRIRSAMTAVRTITPPEQFDVRRRVDLAIDNGGRVIDEARPFVRLRSPDGAVWRVKVSNSGALSATKE